MATINVSGNQVAGQADDISATGLNAADGDQFTWNTSLGSSFSPNPSTVGGGTASTTYTPGGAGTDTVSGSDSDPTDNVSTDVSVAASGGGGGGGGGGSPAWTSNANVIAAFNALSLVQDFTSTAACAPVKAFQSAVAGAGGPVTYTGTPDGGYGTGTAGAAGQVAAYLTSQGGATINAPGAISSGFPNCGGGGTQPVTTCPPGQTLVGGVCVSNQAPVVASSSKWWLWLLGAVAVAGVAALAYWAFKTPGGRQTFGMASEKKRSKKKKKASSKKRK